MSAIAHGPSARRERVTALVVESRRRRESVGTVAAVLTEVIRGHPRDAAVFSGIRREQMEVHPIDAPAGIRAGQLLGAAGAGSAHAIDAFLVAVGDLAGGAVIATVDVADLEMLASHASNIIVADINP